MIEPGQFGRAFFLILDFKHQSLDQWNSNALLV